MSRIQELIRKWFSLAITMLLILAAIGLMRSLVGFGTIKNRFIEAQQQVDTLESQKKQFESQLQVEDQAFVEEEQLRNGLGLAREGETVMIIPKDLLEKTMREQQADEKKEGEKANWQKWMELFL